MYYYHYVYVYFKSILRKFEKAFTAFCCIRSKRKLPELRMSVRSCVQKSALTETVVLVDLLTYLNTYDVHVRFVATAADQHYAYQFVLFQARCSYHTVAESLLYNAG